MKRVLILGANAETVSLINKAREMGIYTIVTDYTPGAYAKDFSDSSFDIDATDIDALGKLAINEKVDGILVGVAEALIPTYCELCSRLKLPCYLTENQNSILSNKINFKNACKKYGVSTPPLCENINNPIFPIIIKPTDSSGSKGITVCNSETDVENAVKKAVSYSKEGKYIAEQYISGDEFIAYFVIVNGEPFFVGCCDRYVFREDSGDVQLPISYIFQSKYTKMFYRQQRLLLENFIKKLKLKYGSIFFQGIVKKDGGFIFYEAGYRLNGAQEHILLSELYGIDAKELYIKYSLEGDKCDIRITAPDVINDTRVGCKLSPIIMPGRIQTIEGLDEIRSMEDVVEVLPSYRAGDIVVDKGTLKQIVCRFYIVAADHKKLREDIHRILKLFEVKDEQGRSMIISTFTEGFSE